MILGRDRHPASACFDELDAAIRAMTTRTVVLNAHAFPNEIPAGAVVYNLENIPKQVQPTAFAGHEIWDFSLENVEKWRAAGRKAKHVPLGYHPSMRTFTMKPWAERDIDVVFTGCMNERRSRVLQALRDRGLRVVTIGPGAAYGAERDEVLARSKLALNMLWEEGALYPSLRAAHAAANGLTMLSEWGKGKPVWAGLSCEHAELARVAEGIVRDQRKAEQLATWSREAFAAVPMTLPDPWAMVRGDPARADEWDLEAMYEGGRECPVSETPLVCIVVATYRETERVAKAARQTRNAVREHLDARGINSMVLHIDGDSLVCRMRQRACHMFLATQATHLLFWDADIACRTPDCVAEMIASGHDVVAGACPFKDVTGRTVHNLWPKDAERMREGAQVEMRHGCIEVRDAGTGFMLLSRRALVTLQQRHPELLHWSVSTSEDRGAPLWALFDTGVVDGEYRSEDYRFCHLWQQAGGKVYVYAPAEFTHYGEHGFEASFYEQYGLVAGSP